MLRRQALAALAAAVFSTGGCYRMTHEIADRENPDTVFLTPAEQGGDRTRFQVDVTYYTSLWGLIAWNYPSATEALTTYYNSGKVENLIVHQDQNFSEGFITNLMGFGLIVGIRHVRYEGYVARHVGSY